VTSGSDEDGLVVGGLYDVDADDCCLTVAFVSTLVSAVSNSWPDVETVWSNGVTLRSSTAVMELLSQERADA
jgi:hypothetical protein